MSRPSVTHYVGLTASALSDGTYVVRVIRRVPGAVQLVPTELDHGFMPTPGVPALLAVLADVSARVVVAEETGDLVL